MLDVLRNWPKLWLSLVMLLLTFAIGQAIGLAPALPSGDRVAFIGESYLIPLVAVALWGVLCLLGQRREAAFSYLVALPSYAVVLICHFNVKLWRPLINPANWDQLYYRIDTALRPLVDACIALRLWLAPLVPLDSAVYTGAFLSMFYVSFCFHAFRSHDDFRKLVLAALIFQILGTFAYLVMPALWPFIYERGIEPAQTEAQLMMLGSYQAILAQGTDWFAQNGPSQLTVGLAAMPSLHVGGALLFLIMARRYARPLYALYAALFAFIVIDAVASRWHYLINLPVGMLLAWASIRTADALDRWRRGSDEDTAPDAQLVNGNSSPALGNPQSFPIIHHSSQ